MSLKTFVKVGNVTNLSDARYCAGMGVDVIGIDVNPGSPSYVSPEKFQEIAGWVAGVSYCLEVGGDAVDQMDLLKPEYQYDFVESQDLNVLNAVIGKSKILKVSIEEPSDLDKLLSLENSDVDYLLLESENEDLYNQIQDKVQQLDNSIKVIKGFNVTDQNVLSIEQEGFAGVGLKGSEEIRPGYKDYDELADILEVLEED